MHAQVGNDERSVLKTLTNRVVLFISCNEKLELQDKEVIYGKVLLEAALLQIGMSNKILLNIIHIITLTKLSYYSIKQIWKFN